jgi:hypothetical protein
VQVLKAAVGTNNGRIRVVDGKFTGQQMEVTPAEMVKMSDER